MRFALLFLLACHDSPPTQTQTQTQTLTPTPTQTQTQTPTPTLAPTLTQPPASPTACTSDTDCVATSFVSCCAECPTMPHAISQAALAAKQSACASMDCKQRGTHAACPKFARPEDYRAECHEGECTIIPK